MKRLILTTVLLSLSLSLTPASADHDPWVEVRHCESTNNYQLEHGIYSGAYQFDQQTWDGVASRHYPHLVGVRPSSATPEEQDAMANALYSERGTQPWPYCGRFYNGAHPEETAADQPPPQTPSTASEAPSAVIPPPAPVTASPVEVAPNPVFTG